MPTKRKTPEEIRLVRQKAALKSAKTRRALMKHKLPETSIRLYKKDIHRINKVCDALKINQKDALSVIIDTYEATKGS